MFNVTLKQIQYFLAAAEAGQFSAAAAKVNVTQTAVTASIKELEDAVGVKLFIRGPSGVSLTLDGVEFLNCANAIRTALTPSNFASGLATKGLQGKVRLAATQSMFWAYLVPVAATFAQSCPGVEVTLSELQEVELMSALAREQVDIAFHWFHAAGESRQNQDLRSVVIGRARNQLWLSANHPLLNMESIGLVDVLKFPYVLYVEDGIPELTENYLRRFGAAPDCIIRVSKIEAVRTLVADGFGVTILVDVLYRPFSLQGRRIEPRPVLDLLPVVEATALWRSDRPKSPAVHALCDTIEQLVDQL